MLSDNATQERILRLPQVKALTGLGRSTIYSLIKAGRFPNHISLGGARCVGWIESECQAWVTNQIKENRPSKPD